MFFSSGIFKCFCSFLWDFLYIQVSFSSGISERFPSVFFDSASFGIFSRLKMDAHGGEKVF